jgi:hypothetical protein
LAGSISARSVERPSTSKGIPATAAISIRPGIAARRITA